MSEKAALGSEADPVERDRLLVGDLPLFLLDQHITLDHQLAVQRVVDKWLPGMRGLEERVELLERDRQEAWSALEYAVNWLQHVFGGEEVTVSQEEWLAVRNRLLNAGEFAHFMRADEADRG